ncbi:putative membrane protein [Priestia megaterium]|uniref:Putative membrane protein n=1 Tax=Priestia megaterium (strain ATCC 14581 / DSM 32 / CCUG 1817 / JCM 2506 / NBRC 15308 / NCIMB 9376 / NCTC 10342 / NRRL B-14308 / VKM B-512 / Ford 19) TaxID=1348623 RepID=A0A0B6AQP9_PRIM2|nr:hypothetical protein [Priestia megaterium]AJI25680.1 putative membrane protein [Priestia megaterium NBRC 15308 = ATCC 14581]AJI25786.1 putative membrane protein [Priestia megaterium NBRC 15308 = ATCC 14581]KFM95515.1 putative membrane protein [Priestia megaterium]MBU8756906.1 hypothetical protein [Priestia megaterium]NER44931.1 hypothetical protein [Priestia megaterium NBRC 15308 = ATCC 14581]
MPQAIVIVLALFLFISLIRNRLFNAILLTGVPLTIITVAHESFELLSMLDVSIDG